KLFSMNATRFPSGDHDARSPKCDSRVMPGGRLSSGLPGRVPCGALDASAAANRTARRLRMARIAPYLARAVNTTGRPCVLRSADMHAVRMRILLLLLLSSLPGPAALTASAQTATAPPLSELSRAMQDLSARVSPSVVQIFVTG